MFGDALKIIKLSEMAAIPIPEKRKDIVLTHKEAQELHRKTTWAWNKICSVFDVIPENKVYFCDTINCEFHFLVYKKIVNPIIMAASKNLIENPFMGQEDAYKPYYYQKIIKRHQFIDPKTEQEKWLCDECANKMRKEADSVL